MSYGYWSQRPSVRDNYKAVLEGYSRLSLFSTLCRYISLSIVSDQSAQLIPGSGGDTFSSCHTAVIYIILKMSQVAVSEGLENMIHKPLHACRGIGWSKAHYSGGIKSSGHFKGHQVLSLLTVTNIPIAIAQIKFTKEYHATHSFDNRINSREGEDIFDHNGIYFLVVEYRTVASILLFDIEYRDRVWRFQFLDQASIFLLFDVFRLKLLFSTG